MQIWNSADLEQLVFGHFICHKSGYFLSRFWVWLDLHLVFLCEPHFNQRMINWESGRCSPFSSLFDHLSKQNSFWRWILMWYWELLGIFLTRQKTQKRNIAACQLWEIVLPGIYSGLLHKSKSKILIFHSKWLLVNKSQSFSAWNSLCSIWMPSFVNPPPDFSVLRRNIMLQKEPICQPCIDDLTQFWHSRAPLLTPASQRSSQVTFSGKWIAQSIILQPWACTTDMWHLLLPVCKSGHNFRDAWGRLINVAYVRGGGGEAGCLPVDVHDIQELISSPATKWLCVCS